LGAPPGRENVVSVVKRAVVSPLETPGACVAQPPLYWNALMPPSAGQETPRKFRFKLLPTLKRGEMWRYFGPAFVASVAYIDPGNFASNFEGGARFGYTLLWVLLWSNAMAILIQYLSAKLGIATGKTLPQNCRAYFSPKVNFGLWIAAELAALATDLAEFLGAALGFYLLLHIPLFPAALITAVVVFLMLAVELYGFRRLEQLIMVFVFAIAACYAFEMFLVHPDWGAVAHGVLVPKINSDSIYIAVSMLGATVMPHVIYLHSALVQHRVKEDALSDHPEKWVLTNSAMIVMAAAVFYNKGVNFTFDEAHLTLHPLLPAVSGTAFALALLFSGLSSSTVGTMAGQVIIEGFLDIKFSVFLRRLLTIIPALVVIALRLDALKILLLSQVVLSFAIPFALIPLVLLTRSKAVMSDLVNSPRTNYMAYLVTAIIVALNLLLIYRMLGGNF
jgi:manganese transport protein